MDKISSQLEPWILMMKHIDRRAMSLETMMCQNVQDMQGLKHWLDMVYVKHPVHVDRGCPISEPQFPLTNWKY